jgi:hypothetical protein
MHYVDCRRYLSDTPVNYCVKPLTLFGDTSTLRTS